MTVQAYFLSGPLRGVKADLKYAPPQVEILGDRYDRVNDPDSGEYLGGYVLHQDPPPVMHSDFWYDREMFKYPEIDAAPRKPWWKRWFR